MKEAQEIHCHNCDKYVRFQLDLSLDGNHVLECPNCGHEHCRVVKDGKITSDRWDSRNGQTYTVWTYSKISVAASSSSGGDYYLGSAWANSCTTAGTW